MRKYVIKIIKIGDLIDAYYIKDKNFGLKKTQNN